MAFLSDMFGSLIPSPIVDTFIPRGAQNIISQGAPIMGKEIVQKATKSGMADPLIERTIDIASQIAVRGLKSTKNKILKGIKSSKIGSKIIKGLKKAAGAIKSLV